MYCKFPKIRPLGTNALPLFNPKFLHRYFTHVIMPRIERLMGMLLVSFWFSSIFDCVHKHVHTKFLIALFTGHSQHY